jgi:lysozyme family protein
MKSNFDAAFSSMLRSEGFGVRRDNPYGFSDNPRDPGGVTQLGVTQRAWEEWVGQPVTVADMKALRPETVKPFYRVKYWDAINGDNLPSGIDYAAFDLSVNSGSSRAARYLQSIVGVATDGHIGPATLAALAKRKPKDVIAELCAMRMSFLKRLPTWNDFGNGWTRRVADVELRASMMANIA